MNKNIHKILKTLFDCCTILTITVEEASRKTIGDRNDVDSISFRYLFDQPFLTGLESAFYIFVGRLCTVLWRQLGWGSLGVFRAAENHRPVDGGAG